MNNDKKVFAFKLAEKKENEKEKAASTKWKARDGVSVAGCTDPTGQGDYRFGTRYSQDGGVWC
ncbi:MAG TPA: hypothetical protein VE153_29920 [Myxococcus sp.]|nr:hypothetical protein [Myxococcus sp.]